MKYYRCNTASTKIATAYFLIRFAQMFISLLQLTYPYTPYKMCRDTMRSVKCHRASLNYTSHVFCR